MTLEDGYKQYIEQHMHVVPVNKDTIAPLADAPQWVIDKIRATLETEEGKQKCMSTEEIEDLLKGLKEGEERNSACVQLGGHYVVIGMSWKEIEPIMTAWNQRNKPPLSRQEFDSCMRQIRKLWYMRQEAHAGKEMHWDIWLKLKEQGKLEKGAKMPYKALVDYAIQHGYCKPEDIEYGYIIPAETYNKLLWEAPVNLGHKLNITAGNFLDAQMLIKARDALHELGGLKGNPKQCAEFVNNYCKRCKDENVDSFVKRHLGLHSSDGLGSETLDLFFHILETEFGWKSRKPVGKKTIELDEKVDPVIKAKAEEIMRSGDPVKFIIETHQRIHVGDVELAKTLLISIGAQSCLNSEGIQPKLNGESGKGKSHCAKVMAHLVPQKYVLETSLSSKALYYKAPKLPHGVIIFSDDADLSEDMQVLIKRATTAFQEGTRHITLSKDRVVLEMITPKRVVWWITSVYDSESLQLLNRQFGGGVDESKEQDEKVAKHQLKIAALGLPALPLTEDVLICREIIRAVKEKTFMVKIPYAEAIIWNDKGNRRNLPIFLDIIRSYAVMRFMQRYVTNENIIIATLDDFEDAKTLYSGRAENQGLKLTEQEKKICLFLAEYGPSTREEIAVGIGTTPERISQLMHGNKKIVDSGLMNKIGIEKVDITNTVSDGDECHREGTYTRKPKFHLTSGFDKLGMFTNVVSLDTSKLNSVNADRDYIELYQSNIKVNNEIDNSKDRVISVILSENTEQKTEKSYVKHI